MCLFKGTLTYLKGTLSYTYLVVSGFVSFPGLVSVVVAKCLPLGSTSAAASVDAGGWPCRVCILERDGFNLASRAYS